MPMDNASHMDRCQHQWKENEVDAQLNYILEQKRRFCYIFSGITRRIWTTQGSDDGGVANSVTDHVRRLPFCRGLQGKYCQFTKAVRRRQVVSAGKVVRHQV
jgi:hypothetical protein